MNFPHHLRYTKDHEWIHLEGNIATIGITDFAQSELGDIVYVEPIRKPFSEGVRDYGPILSIITTLTTLIVVIVSL